MIRQYLKSAWRYLWRNKLSSVLNITGLAIGLSTGILAMLFSYHEFTYEQHHENADRLARVITYGNFGAFQQLPNSFPQTAFDLPEKYPEIEQAVRSQTVEGIVFMGEEPIHEKRLLTTEKQFFDLFTYNFIKGQFTGQSNTMVISESMANKYFDNENPLGKTLKVEIYGNIFYLTVEGVYQDLPDNTLVKTPAILSWSVAQYIFTERRGFGSTSFDVYCLLHPNSNVKALNNQIALNYEIPTTIEDCKVALMPIKDFHLRSVFENNKANLYILFIGGIVALLIAILNYINQSTILYSMRVQEVGIRLSNGGKAKDIFIQFMADTFLVTLLGFSLALLILKLVLPYFNNLVDTNLSLSLGLIPSLIVVMIFAFTVFMAGFYPSMIMSRLKPVQLLRFSGKNGIGKSRMRSITTTIQFVFAILLMQSMLVTQKQGIHMSDRNVIGYNTDNVLAINGYKWGDLDKVKTELLRNTSIEAVTWGANMPGIQTSMTSDWLEPNNTMMANRTTCEADFLSLFDIELKKGRFFEKENQSDLTNAVVVNQLLVDNLGWDDPVGKKLMVYEKDLTIIGVVDNYMASPPIFDDTPLLMLPEKQYGGNLIIRFNPEREAEARSYITSVLRKSNPSYPINLKTYNEITYELAKTFISMGTLVNGFVIIIIINAFLSLFGLSHFMAERSKKTIGIKKVFGASVLNIYWRLSKSFVWRFVIAFAIITPMSYFSSLQFLNTFSRPMPLSADVFIQSGILVLAILLLATGFKIVKAANQNPVESLRYE